VSGTAFVTPLLLLAAWSLRLFCAPNYAAFTRYTDAWQTPVPMISRELGIKAEGDHARILGKYLSSHGGHAANSTDRV
jgi:hypothetical protein